MSTYIRAYPSVMEAKGARWSFIKEHAEEVEEHSPASLYVKLKNGELYLFVATPVSFDMSRLFGLEGEIDISRVSLRLQEHVYAIEQYAKAYSGRE